MSISTITSRIGDISSTRYVVPSAVTQDNQQQTKTLEQVFSNLDTTGKGYLDAGDFETAFAALDLNDSEEQSDGKLTLPGVEDVVAALDMDGDGKVSAEDLSEGMRSLTDSLSVLQGRPERWSDTALGAMPATDQSAGFTQEELSKQWDELTVSGSTQDNGAVLLSSILNQFATVDTDDDSRVSGVEAMSFAQTLRSDTTQDTEETRARETASSADSTSGSASSSEQLVMRRIMQLVNTYGTSYRPNESNESLSLVA